MGKTLEKCFVFGGKTFFSVFFPRIFGRGRHGSPGPSTQLYTDTCRVWVLERSAAVLRSCCMSMGYIGSLLALLRKRSLKKRIKSFQEFDPLIVCLKSVKNSTKFFAKKVPRKIPPNYLGINLKWNSISFSGVTLTHFQMSCQDVLEKAGLNDNCHAVHS